MINISKYIKSYINISFRTFSIYLFIGFLILIDSSSVDGYQFEIGNFNFYSSENAPAQKISKRDLNQASSSIYVTAHDQPIAVILSNNTINYGILSAGEPFLRSHVLRVPKNSISPINFFISQDTSPISITGSQIPDTRCDQGICSELLAASWKSPLTYGIGFRCDTLEESVGICARDFLDKSNYRQIPNISLKEKPALFFTTNNNMKDTKFELTYKINVPLSEQEKGYKHELSIVALPAL